MSQQEQEQEQEQEQPQQCECVVCGHMVDEDEAILISPDPCGHWREDGPAHVDCTQQCASCGCYMPDGSGESVISRGHSYQTYCTQCRYDHTWSCQTCEETYCESVEAYEFDGEYYCRSCGREAEQEAQSHVIGDYHNSRRRSLTHPIESEWTRNNGKRHLGVEIEFERHSSAYVSTFDIAAELLDTANAGRNEYSPLLFAERDGSLRDGFELITQPMGLDEHRKLWERVLSSPMMRHLRSHDTDTCGLHVHVSRTGISQLTLAKCVVFLNSPENEKLIRTVARRYNTGYCHRKPAKLSRSACEGRDRYEMLNTTGRHTVEFRIFRGSTRVETVLACCEFAHALLTWCAMASCADVTGQCASGAFLRYVFDRKNAADTRALRALLRRRDLDTVATIAAELERDGIAHTAHDTLNTNTNTEDQ